jgi:hypothetical protein
VFVVLLPQNSGRIFYGNKNHLHPKEDTRHFITKNQLMLSRSILNRIIILGFMVLVGFCLAKAIYTQSVMGIVLALTSLGAAVYFLYLLAKAREEMQREETV